MYAYDQLELDLSEALGKVGESHRDKTRKNGCRERLHKRISDTFEPLILRPYYRLKYQS